VRISFTMTFRASIVYSAAAAAGVGVARRIARSPGIDAATTGTSFFSSRIRSCARKSNK
jgi:hypothetical protein